MTSLVSGNKYLAAPSGQFLINIITSGIEGFDDPDNWIRYVSNPVITPGSTGAWDDNWVHPVTVLLNGSTYHLYYGGVPASGNPSQGGLATSSDGLTWTKHPSNPILPNGADGTWDDTRAGSMVVIKEGSSWYAWYPGHGGDNVYKIGYATSSDGIAWTKYGSNPIMQGTAATWDSAFVIPTNVFKEGSTYYLVYFGGTNINDHTTYKIGLATSTDRINWTKHASNPILSGNVGQWDDGVLDASITKVGITYYMFYQGNTSDQNFSAIGVSTSTDLINWTKSPNNPFPRGGGWESAWNEAPKLIEIGGVWHMYYMGSTGAAGLKQIGLMQFQQ